MKLCPINKQLMYGTPTSVSTPCSSISGSMLHMTNKQKTYEFRDRIGARTLLKIKLEEQLTRHRMQNVTNIGSSRDEGK
jgi:hypothetical protein